MSGSVSYTDDAFEEEEDNALLPLAEACILLDAAEVKKIWLELGSPSLCGKICRDPFLPEHASCATPFDYMILAKQNFEWGNDCVKADYSELIGLLQKWRSYVSHEGLQALTIDCGELVDLVSQGLQLDGLDLIGCEAGSVDNYSYFGSILTDFSHEGGSSEILAIFRRLIAAGLDVWPFPLEGPANSLPVIDDDSKEQLEVARLLWPEHFETDELD